jgi:hypothetical protein
MHVTCISFPDISLLQKIKEKGGPAKAGVDLQNAYSIYCKFVEEKFEDLFVEDKRRKTEEVNRKGEARKNQEEYIPPEGAAPSTTTMTVKLSLEGFCKEIPEFKTYFKLFQKT